MMETATMAGGPARYAIATVAGGCFWCTEAVFKRLKGVKSVVSGYTGGTVPDPSYDEVCAGNTGHAEAIQIEFDPQLIPYEKLLEIFFHLHDPTTINQQGNDIGTRTVQPFSITMKSSKPMPKKLKRKLSRDIFIPIP